MTCIGEKATFGKGSATFWPNGTRSMKTPGWWWAEREPGGSGNANRTLHSCIYTLDRFHVARDLKRYVGHLPSVWKAARMALAKQDPAALLKEVERVPIEAIALEKQEEWTAYKSFLRRHRKHLKLRGRSSRPLCGCVFCIRTEENAGSTACFLQGEHAVFPCELATGQCGICRRPRSSMVAASGASSGLSSCRSSSRLRLRASSSRRCGPGTTFWRRCRF
jgi:Uncharacterised protein family (UPF0236).